jgi:hypothetical protein
MYCENPAVDRAATVIVISLQEGKMSSHIKVVGNLQGILERDLARFEPEVICST